jgi:flagellar hook assembly protein FlgD
MTVSDWAGNDSVVSRSVNIDQLRITSVSRTPEAINPTAAETSSVAFTLDRPADVSFRMYRRGSHALVRTLLDDEPTAAGTSGVVWDGRDDADEIVANDSYYFSIQAADGSGRSVTYIDPVTPKLGSNYGANNWKINGIPAAQISTVQFDPYGTTSS